MLEGEVPLKSAFSSMCPKPKHNHREHNSFPHEQLLNPHHMCQELEIVNRLAEEAWCDTEEYCEQHRHSAWEVACTKQTLT